MIMVFTFLAKADVLFEKFVNCFARLFRRQPDRMKIRSVVGLELDPAAVARGGLFEG